MAARPPSDRQPTGSNALQQLRNSLSWQILTFYLMVPLALGSYGAINNWRLIESIGPLWAIGFYLGHAFPPWFSTCLLTSLAMHLLKPWKPRPSIIMLSGHTLSCVITLPYISWLISLFAVWWPGSGLEAPPTNLLAAGYWAYWLRAGTVWLGMNFVFDRFLGLPRYRYDAVLPGATPDPVAANSSIAVPSESRPAFLERAPVTVSLADVIAVKAEQHYIRIITATRSYLVLHRFSDALCELPSNEGLQLHRSWWVRRNAIKRVRHSSRRMAVILQTGEEIPVSGPYQALVRQFARATELPVTPLTTDTGSRSLPGD
jgi:hypothetical protein